MIDAEGYIEKIFYSIYIYFFNIARFFLNIYISFFLWLNRYEIDKSMHILYTHIITPIENQRMKPARALQLKIE